MRESSGSGRGRADAETERAEHFRGGLSAHLDPIEAARETLFDPGCLDRIRRCRESLSQQAQFFRTKAVTLAFKDSKFRCLESNLFTGWLARHDPAPGEGLPHEPVIHGQCALDHLGSL